MASTDLRVFFLFKMSPSQELSWSSVGTLLLPKNVKRGRYFATLTMPQSHPHLTFALTLSSFSLSPSLTLCLPLFLCLWKIYNLTSKLFLVFCCCCCYLFLHLCFLNTNLPNFVCFCPFVFLWKPLFLFLSFSTPLSREINLFCNTKALATCK